MMGHPLLGIAVTFPGQVRCLAGNATASRSRWRLPDGRSLIGALSASGEDASGVHRVVPTADIAEHG
jgi:hypothetical protein